MVRRAPGMVRINKTVITHPFSLSIVTYKWFRWCGIAELTWRVECKAKRKADPSLRSDDISTRRRGGMAKTAGGGNAGRTEVRLYTIGRAQWRRSAAADGAVEFNLGSLWTDEVNCGHEDSSAT